MGCPSSAKELRAVAEVGQKFFPLGPIGRGGVFVAAFMVPVYLAKQKVLSSFIGKGVWSQISSGRNGRTAVAKI